MELLIVMTILGIISIISIGLVRNASPQARDARRKTDLSQIQNALEIYYADNESYPASISFGNEFSYGGKTYMAKLPQDPQNPRNEAGKNTYIYQTNGQSYELYSCLEVTDGATTYSTYDCCDTGSCYYSLTSSDVIPGGISTPTIP